jgi:hypothetical protein
MGVFSLAGFVLGLRCMSHDRLDVFRAPNSVDRFIVVVLDPRRTSDKPLHVSTELACDEARNLLRHYNFADSEIDSKLASATLGLVAAAAGR